MRTQVDELKAEVRSLRDQLDAQDQIMRSLMKYIGTVPREESAPKDSGPAAPVPPSEPPAPLPDTGPGGGDTGTGQVPVPALPPTVHQDYT